MDGRGSKDRKLWRGMKTYALKVIPKKNLTLTRHIEGNIFGEELGSE